MKNCSEESESSFIVDPNTNRIYIYGEIDSPLSLAIAEKLPEFNVYSPCFVNINSMGGIVEPTISIISQLKNSGFEIHTNVTGVAYSAAAFILLAGHKRSMSSIGSIMFHGIKKSYPEPEDIKAVEYSSIKDQEQAKRLMEFLLKDTKLNYSTYCKMINGKEWYLSPQEAKKYGIIHEID